MADRIIDATEIYIYRNNLLNQDDISIQHLIVSYHTI